MIEQGATKISFNAWTETGESLDLEFFAGGIGDLGSAYADSFSSKILVTVSYFLIRADPDWSRRFEKQEPRSHSSE